MPPRLPNPIFALHDTVAIKDNGEGVIVGRSFTKPVQYDVRLESGLVVKAVTEVTLVKRYDGPRIESIP